MSLEPTPSPSSPSSPSSPLPLSSSSSSSSVKEGCLSFNAVFLSCVALWGDKTANRLLATLLFKKKNTLIQLSTY